MQNTEWFNILHESGLRTTPQRIAICELLIGSHNHPTAHEIYTSLKQKYPSLSLATVYNTLDVLAGMGMINALGSVGDGKVHFDANISPHINLACLHCHKIIDTTSDLVMEMDQEIKQRSNYDLQGSKIMYFGYCPSCQSLIQKEKP